MVGLEGFSDTDRNEETVKMLITITATYEVEPGVGGYEGMSAAECAAYEETLLTDRSTDPGEFLEYVNDLTYSITPVSE